MTTCSRAGTSARDITWRQLPQLLTLAAAERLTWADVRVMRTLMWVRSAGRLRFSPDRPVLDDMARLGFTVLARTDDELVAAAVGRPWAPGGVPAPRLADQPDPVEFFVDFSVPGWAKMILNSRSRWRVDHRDPGAADRRWVAARVPPLLAGHPAVQRSHPPRLAGRNRAPHQIGAHCRTAIGINAWIAAAWCVAITVVGYVWAGKLANRDPHSDSGRP